MNWLQVKPIIVYPYCYKVGKKQDCFNCELYKRQVCKSPLGLCVKSYYSHKKGCPNYGKHKYCPPNLPMFDQVFDLSRPIYAIYNKFDFKGHVERMQQRHPDWSDRQLANCLYWQGNARKRLKEHIAGFDKLFASKGYVVTRSPEAMGVNMTETMKAAGIELEWPPSRFTYQIVMAGILQESSGDFLEHPLCWS